MENHKLQRILEILDGVEKHPDEIYVRHGAQTVTFTELPGPVAVRFLCDWIRRACSDPQ